jgi:hypothetical protein
MGHDRKIEKFIRLSIRKKTFIVAELQEILNALKQEKLQDYWMHFAATRSFSKAESIPYWETKRQQNYFQNALSSYLYYPAEKDKNGKYIIDREDFQNHIIINLERYINEEIEKETRSKNRSIIEKINFYFLMASFILILPFCVVSVLAYNKIGADSDTAKVIYNSIGISMFVAWTCYILLSLLIPFVVRKK